MLTLETRRCKGMDIDGNEFYYYFVTNTEAIQRHKQYLANANGKFFRIFCHKCHIYNVLNDCCESKCDNREVKTISLDKLRNGGHMGMQRSSTCFAHNANIVPFDSINKCSSCSKECYEWDIFDSYYNYYGEEYIMNKAKAWLNEMIECKQCNKRFCKECQENGTLGEYLFSKRDSLHVCFGQTSETMSKNQCGKCLKRKISKEWMSGLSKCNICRTRVCRECAGAGFHSDLCYGNAFKQSRNGVFNECLMDYKFIVDGNQTKKMLK